MNFEYLLYMIPGLLLSLFAQAKVKSAYSKWSQVRNYHNLTGLDTAEQLKPRVGLENVKVTRTKGTLTDHYDPRNDTLALSRGWQISRQSPRWQLRRTNLGTPCRIRPVMVRCACALRLCRW